MADKDSGPKTINDVKLINAGRILENNKTLGESRLPVAEVPGGVITMHVVVRPPMNEKARGKFTIFCNHRNSDHGKCVLDRCFNVSCSRLRST